VPNFQQSLKKISYHVRFIAGSRASAGVYAVLLYYLLRVAAMVRLRGPEIWRFQPRQTIYPLKVRLRSSSDLNVFHQIFIFQEYSCLRGLPEPTLVLDFGANVGFSSAFFLSIFPAARVIAVEPDDQNVALCAANLSPYGDRAKVLHGAVWSQPKKLRLSRGTFADGREWATEVVDDLAAWDDGVQAWDVGSLIDMSGGSSVDLLKVDIEGSELAVFSNASPWIHKIKNICIELHGKECSDAFFAALKDFDYEIERSGELTICRNLRAKH
jgi:FkbM family methyltransferase